MIYLFIYLCEDHHNIFLYLIILLNIHFLIVDVFVQLSYLFILFYFINIDIFNLVYCNYLKFGMIVVFIVQMLSCMYFFHFIINIFIFNFFILVYCNLLELILNLFLRYLRLAFSHLFVTIIPLSSLLNPKLIDLFLYLYLKLVGYFEIF